MNPTNSIRGWAMFKNGELHSRSLERTKRSLLIGYDMMPLRGLAKTEKHLRDNGYVAMRAVVRIAADDENPDALVPAINGKLTSELLSWASWPTDIEGVLFRACLYFSERLPICGYSNRSALNKFIFTPMRQEKRRKQRGLKALAILNDSGITFVPVVWEQVK